VAEGGVTAPLLRALMDDLAGLSALRVHLRPNPLHAPLWSAATADRHRVDTKPARAQVLDLSGGFETVWRERFRSETRTSVRKAERLGVQVQTDTAGRLLPVFHHLLQTSVDRWADQQHEPRALARLRLTHRDPLDKLEAIAAHLGDACRTSVAWYDGRPVAGVIVLRGRNAHFTRAAMDKDLAGPTRASTLLQKVAIEDACAAGCRWYHMGESSAGSGVSDFKQRLGAVAHEYAEYFVEPVPFLAMDRAARTVVKRMIGFRDA
jgi:lipid II:glycine glycyltransferase (peptidoglycan interpeptide bridge formation enzyme)